MFITQCLTSRASSDHSRTVSRTYSNSRDLLAFWRHDPHIQQYLENPSRRDATSLKLHLPTQLLHAVHMTPIANTAEDNRPGPEHSGIWGGTKRSVTETEGSHKDGYWSLVETRKESLPKPTPGYNTTRLLAYHLRTCNSEHQYLESCTTTSYRWLLSANVQDSVSYRTDY